MKSSRLSPRPPFANRVTHDDEGRKAGTTKARAAAGVGPREGRGARGARRRGARDETGLGVRATVMFFAQILAPTNRG